MKITSEEQIHVFDLPQMYRKPSISAMRDALELLRLEPVTFDLKASRANKVNPKGVTKYLTSIIASDLSWIHNESSREEIQELASKRLSERSGRTGMGDIHRQFSIPTQEGTVELSIHEPALTEDNLGLKTWSSSYALAKRLNMLKDIPGLLKNLDETSAALPILELGSGTGLVGMAAAVVWRYPVILTDLPTILTNLNRNIDENHKQISHASQCYRGVLDWQDPQHITHHNFHTSDIGHFTVILAADCLYAYEHAEQLVGVLHKWLKRSKKSRFVLAYPLRNGFEDQIRHFRSLMKLTDLALLDEGCDITKDDWDAEVTHSWSVWGWHTDHTAD